MGKTRRSKKRTQKEGEEEGDDGAPKCMVFSRGKATKSLRLLTTDVKRIMEPNCASKLKSKSTNKLKDFLHLAGPLGVKFFLILSATDVAAYLRLARCPRGPTLTFKLNKYSLTGDVVKSLKTPHSPNGMEFKTPPLLVLNNFPKEEKHEQLMGVMWQNLFPSINVHEINLATCKRVLLLHYETETGNIQLRQYAISALPAGLKRPVKRMFRRKEMPNLGKISDISEFILNDAGLSESEAESDVEGTHTMEYSQAAVGGVKTQSAIKLTELGPRLEMQLMRVEAGMCEGDVMYHAFVEKSEEEKEALRQDAHRRKSMKEQRRKEQDANVQRKNQEAQANKKRGEKRNRAERQGQQPWQVNDEVEGEVEMNDADWYRQEVGEQPDADQFQDSEPGQGQSAAKRPKYNPNYSKKNQKTKGASLAKAAPPKMGSGGKRSPGPKKSGR